MNAFDYFIFVDPEVTQLVMTIGLEDIPLCKSPDAAVYIGDYHCSMEKDIKGDNITSMIPENPCTLVKF